jgi:hypothetical protein
MAELVDEGACWGSGVSMYVCVGVDLVSSVYATVL